MLLHTLAHFAPEPPAIVAAFIKNNELPGLLAALLQPHGLTLPEKEFQAEKKEVLTLLTPGGTKVLLLGLGEQPGVRDVVQAFRRGFQQQKSKLPAHVGIDATPLPAAWAEWAVNGALLGGYRLGLYKTTESPESAFFGPEGRLSVRVAEPDACRQAIEQAALIAETQLRIFDLMNAPANHKSPQALAAWAMTSGEQYGYTVRALDRGEAEAAGLHALVAVSKGSPQEPSFIIGEYNGPGACRTVGLVGKGVTFDTGGISIKNYQNMHLMKSDMGGAAAVLGTLEAAARLQLPVRLIGIVPATENCIDGESMKPGDVIGSFSGKTIEVINTDAEGRLILADGLAYLHKHYQPEVMIDLATLTGSVILALGYAAAGLFTPNQQLSQALQAAGEATGERLWPLPLWADYAEHLKSDIADVRNLSDLPHSGAIAAGKFLEFFTDSHPCWAHLDIAGVAFGETDFAPQRGGTAFGVRLLVAYLQGLVGAGPSAT